MKKKFYVGSYATAKENSIYEYELDSGTGELCRLNSIKEVDNPSYLLVHPNGKIMYAVEELTPEGRIAVFAIKDKPEYLFSMPSNGADPCHISMDEEGKYLFIANYTSGSLSTYQLDQDGKPIKCTDYKQHKGHGSNPQRQEGAHVHFSGMIDHMLHTCDLGTDRMVIYSLDQKNGTLHESESSFHFADGFGPRHFAIHKKYLNCVYVVGELTGEVAVLQKTGNNYTQIQKISSLPEQFAKENTAAAIKFNEDGTLLFVSNRGSDTITGFAVKEDGTLEKADICSSGGKGPRDFEIFGEYIVVANQYTDNLAVMKYEMKTAKMQIISNDEKIKQPVMIESIS